MVQQPRSFDVIVVGGGPGGYVAAMRSSQLGMSVALVEREELGGVCNNWGCIPSKAILRSAEVLHLIHNARAHGITVGDVQADFDHALKRARDIALRQVRGVAYLMRKYKVEVVRGTARLQNADHISVETPEGTVTLHATRAIILATGSRVNWLPNLQPDGARIVSSREVWNANGLPDSIVLLGGGPIGCEFATVFSAFGVRVTLVEMLPRLLPREDPDSSAALTKEFKRRGIAVLTGMMFEHAEVHAAGVRVRLAATPHSGAEPPAPVELDVERVMLSAGFAPNSRDIGLEQVGVQVTQRGYIDVNDQMRTNIPTIYAIGDVTGKLPLAHVAEAQGQVAAEVIAGVKPFPLDYQSMPRVTYSNPQVAGLGLLEAEAQALGIRYRVVTAPFMPNGKARALGETVGQVKLLVDERGGEIIGAHLVGPDVSELIGEITLARTLEATPLELGRSVHAHPTLSEVVAEAALDWAGMPLAM